MVFFLVKYIEDGIYQVVPKVFRRGSKVCAKYLDGCIYPSEIIAKNHSHNVLDQILRNLQLDLPKVIVGDKFFRCSEEKDSLQDEITLVENIQTIPDDIKVVENEIQSIKPEALSLEGCLPLVTDSFQDEITLLENIQTISEDIKIVEHEIQSIKTEALSLEDLPLVTVRDIVINQDESPVVPNQGQSSHTQILSTQDSVPLVPDSKQYQILAVQNIMTIQDETQGVHNDQSIQASALSVQNSLSLLPVFGTAPAIVYITEIARSDLRGSLISFGPAISSVGMVMAYIEGWFLSWRLTAWLCVFYSAISFILLMLIPESPMWLIAKEKNSRALKSLEWFTKSKPNSNREGRKTPAEIQFENLREINEQKIASGMNRGGISEVLQGFLKPTGYKPFLILFGLFIFQQFSGVYITLFYSIQFFEEMGTNINPYLCSIFIGLVRAGMSGVNTYMLKTFRRRPLLLWSSLGMAITMLISGLFTVWIKDGTTTLKWVPVLATLLYVVSSMIGLLTIPWTMTAELFPLEIRAIAHSCLYSAAYLIMFFSIQNYDGLKRLCGGVAGVQWFFAAVSLAGLVYTGLFLPETYKSELSEIEDYFKYNTLYLLRKKGPADPRRGSRYSYRKPPSDIVKKIVLDTVSENSNEQNKNLLTVN